MIEDYGASAAVGTLALRRLPGRDDDGALARHELLDRYGRVPVLRVLTPCRSPGSRSSSTARASGRPSRAPLLWGGGLALGFPVGMSAGADEPARAAPRVSVISSISYCAFLTGPPLIGFLGERVSVLTALTAVIVLLALALLIADAVRPLAPAG